MEDLRKYTRKSEIYKLSAEEQMEKMKLVINLWRKTHMLACGSSQMDYLHKQKKDNKF